MAFRTLFRRLPLRSVGGPSQVVRAAHARSATQARSTILARSFTSMGGSPPQGTAGGGTAPPPPTRQPLPSTVDVNETNINGLIQESTERVVLLVVWSKWSPAWKALESAVKSRGGGVLLGKLNASEQQQIAMQLGVKQVPTMFVLSKGKVVHSMSGEIPVDQIDKFLESVGAPPSETPSAFTMAEQAFMALEGGDVSTAKAMFSDVLKSGSPELNGGAHARAIAGLARVALDEGNASDAKEFAEALRASYKEHLTVGEVKQALSMVELAAGSDGEDKHAEWMQAVEQDPNNLEARLALAKSFFAKGLVDDAIDNALKVVRQDKEWNDGAGKSLVLSICDALGPKNPVANKAKRRLSNLMFV